MRQPLHAKKAIPQEIQQQVDSLLNDEKSVLRVFLNTGSTGNRSYQELLGFDQSKVVALTDLEAAYAVIRERQKQGSLRIDSSFAAEALSGFIRSEKNENMAKLSDSDGEGQTSNTSRAVSPGGLSETTSNPSSPRSKSDEKILHDAQQAKEEEEYDLIIAQHQAEAQKKAAVAYAKEAVAYALEVLKKSTPLLFNYLEKKLQDDALKVLPYTLLELDPKTTKRNDIEKRYDAVSLALSILLKHEASPEKQYRIIGVQAAISDAHDKILRTYDEAAQSTASDSPKKSHQTTSAGSSSFAVRPEPKLSPQQKPASSSKEATRGELAGNKSKSNQRSASPEPSTPFTLDSLKNIKNLVDLNGDNHSKINGQLIANIVATFEKAYNKQRSEAHSWTPEFFAKKLCGNFCEKALQAAQTRGEANKNKTVEQLSDKEKLWLCLKYVEQKPNSWTAKALKEVERGFQETDRPSLSN